MKWIDLHIHSTFSDGTHDPATLIDLAARQGLAALALTDHDTVAGIPDFLNYAAERNLSVLSGIEISAWHGQESLHILGYGIDHNSPNLLKVLGEIQQARHQRNLGILEKLAAMGINISFASIESQENGQVGRPHIARELIRLGVVHDMHTAFVRYLRRGGAAYVESHRIHALDAIRLIAAAGGAPALAHPAVIGGTLEDLSALLTELRRAGLVGMEVYYPAHTRKQHLQLLQLAAEHQLIATGGTDFHADSPGGIPLGGSVHGGRVPFSCYAELVEFLAGRPNSIAPGREQ
ncbi:MAG TPA: PHP domain-containing protein [Desulfurivibrio alkaliphilus]|uniref:PHP domain-containing protein n=1 Tax=Desulfurivibrio alkaliphilus TaxID=427923 RepID=A0A7C2TGM1_9BACT|nr:PHP domain-containing protein [Desulfurivibrio alkaliphilus]